MTSKFFHSIAKNATKQEPETSITTLIAILESFLLRRSYALHNEITPNIRYDESKSLLDEIETMIEKTLIAIIGENKSVLDIQSKISTNYVLVTFPLFQTNRKCNKPEGNEQEINPST